MNQQVKQQLMKGNFHSFLIYLHYSWEYVTTEKLTINSVLPFNSSRIKWKTRRSWTNKNLSSCSSGHTKCSTAATHTCPKQRIKGENFLNYVFVSIRKLTKGHVHPHIHTKKNSQEQIRKNHFTTTY